jgi:hypothetical protein
MHNDNVTRFIRPEEAEEWYTVFFVEGCDRGKKEGKSE